MAFSNTNLTALRAEIITICNISVLLISEMDFFHSGHVIYEMASGRELPSLTPSEEDLELITDSALLNVLEQIFHRDRRDHFTCTADQVSTAHWRDYVCHVVDQIAALSEH